MPKSLSLRKLIQKLCMFGFEGPFSGGRHLFMKRGNIRVIIPNPHRGDIPGWLVAQILKQAGISFEKWEEII